MKPLVQTRPRIGYGNPDATKENGSPLPMMR
jgi:hypothetical protein